MTLYNTTALMNVSGFYDVATYANDITQGMITGMFIMAFYFVAIMVLLRWGFKEAVMSASFVTFVVSLFFLYAGLLNLIVILVIVAMMGLMIALTFFNRGPG